jgi:DNA-binding response OmpR family regulator
MTQSGPRILVVDDEWDERMQIASVLREAGFEVVAAAQDCGASAMADQRFAAAVIALPGDGGLEFLRAARRWQPGVKALIVVEPAALRLVDEDCGTLVKRPFDPRELLGCVFALVLRDDEHGAALGYGHAELGIAAAKLACLNNRRDAAAAVGAELLAQDLTRQIGELTAMHRGLAATTYRGLSLVR